MVFTIAFALTARTCPGGITQGDAHGVRSALGWKLVGPSARYVAIWIALTP